VLYLIFSGTFSLPPDGDEMMRYGGPLSRRVHPGRQFLSEGRLADKLSRRLPQRATPARNKLWME